MEVKNDMIAQVRAGLSAHFPAHRQTMKNPFFGRDEAIWIQTFKPLASKVRELFEVKDGG